MERKFSVYKLISPSGGIYVGLTSYSIWIRWQNHVKRSKKSYNHPLYNAIRKYGKESFWIISLASELTKQKAENLEIEFIAKVPENLSYNLSKGGESDGAEGSRIFWQRIKQNPIEYKKYIAKLSASALGFSDNCHEGFKRWRTENPKEAHRIARRNWRMHNRNHKKKPESERSLKEKLLWKHRRDLATQRAVTKVWANRTEEQKEKVCENISKAHVNFWVELKKDPVKYQKFIHDREVKRFKSLHS